MYYTYVLKSLTSFRYYTGSTNDIDRRFYEHNAGLSKYTRLTRPFELVYVEIYLSRSEAVKREKYLKSGKGREELENILNNLADCVGS